MVVTSDGTLPVAVLGLLAAVASLAVEQAPGRVGFGSCGSRALEHRLSSGGAQS